MERDGERVLKQDVADKQNTSQTAPLTVNEPIQALREQVARLTALVEQQQVMVQRQQAEIAELRGQRYHEQVERTGTPQRGKSGGSARFKPARAAPVGWRGCRGGDRRDGGERAAARQRGMRCANGATLTSGSIVTAENATTGVELDSISIPGPGIVFFAADSTSNSPSSAAYPAALGGYATTGTIANGVYGFSTVTSASGVVGSSTKGVGVKAFSADTAGTPNPALLATHNGSGNGAEITGANDQIGVSGSVGATIGSGFGVLGSASGDFSAGVYGQTDSGIGVVGHSTTGLDLAAGSSGRLYQFPTAATGAPTTGSYSQGEQIRDKNGDLYICVTGGSQGTWKKVAAIPSGAAGGAAVFFATPYRIFDTRGLMGVPLNNGAGNHPMNPTQIIPLQITGTVDPLDSSIVVPSWGDGYHRQSDRHRP